MAELRRRTRRAILLLHVIASVGWLGAGSANLVLAVSARSGSSGVGELAAYRAIELIDLWVVIPAAFTALATGVVLSVGTSWGLTRHWWVLTKFVLTLIVILASTFGIGVWVEHSIAGLTGGRSSQVGGLIVAAAAANLVAFVVMTWLSIDKPRGRTPWSGGTRGSRQSRSSLPQRLSSGGTRRAKPVSPTS